MADHEPNSETKTQPMANAEARVPDTTSRPKSAVGLALILALFQWGLRLIGINVNLYLGGIVLLIVFCLVVYAFWIWETPLRFHVALRILTIFVAALLYFGAIGKQMLAEYRQKPSSSGFVAPVQQPAQLSPSQNTSPEASGTKDRVEVKVRHHGPATPKKKDSAEAPPISSLSQPPSMTIVQPVFGNLRQRSVDLSKEISDEIGPMASWPDDTPEHVTKFVASKSGWYCWHFFPIVIAMRDEFAQFHIRDSRLDDEMKYQCRDGPVVHVLPQEIKDVAERLIELSNKLPQNP